MNSSAVTRLIEILTEIQSDIRQMKSDLQSLLNQRSAPTQTFTLGNEEATDDASVPQSSSESVLKYLRAKRGEDEWGTD